MRERKEFLGILCKIYIVFLMAALPLYTGGSYYGIGDVKYTIFKNVTLFVLGVALIVGAADVISGAINKLPFKKNPGFSGGNPNCFLEEKVRKKMSSTDWFMLLYAGSAIISALFSEYKKEAFWGFPDWHMGALTQFLLVGEYFFVSRCFPIIGLQRKERVSSAGNGHAASGDFYFMFLAVISGIVNLTGILNRLGFDPIRLYIGFQYKDWERSHMLSTLGNINWLCGFLAVAMVPVVMGYLNASDKKREWFYGLLGTLGLTLLLIQGSDGGIATAFLFLLLPPVFDRKAQTIMKQLLLAAGTAAETAILGIGVKVRESMECTPADGFGRRILEWKGLWGAAAIFLAAYVAIRAARKGADAVKNADAEKDADAVKNADAEKGADSVKNAGARIDAGIKNNAGIGKTWKVVLAAVCLTVITAMGIWYFLERGMLPDQFGNDRGALWKLAWKGFRAGSLKQKIIGAGPDCFALYLQNLSAMGTAVTDHDYWAGAVYANAHNEWLNQLVNTGLAGVLCQAGVFCSIFFRKGASMAEKMLVAAYLANSMYSFQQVLNASFFFLLAAIYASIEHGNSLSDDENS